MPSPGIGGNCSPPAGIPPGTAAPCGAPGAAPAYEAVCNNNRWIAPAHTCNVSIPSGALTGPAEGSIIGSWTAFDYRDDGYRNGCAGGEKYIKSTGFAVP